MGNSWRIAGDGTNWAALSNCINSNVFLSQYARPVCTFALSTLLARTPCNAPLGFVEVALLGIELTGRVPGTIRTYCRVLGLAATTKPPTLEAALLPAKYRKPTSGKNLMPIYACPPLTHYPLQPLCNISFFRLQVPDRAPIKSPIFYVVGHVSSASDIGRCWSGESIPARDVG